MKNKAFVFLRHVFLPSYAHLPLMLGLLLPLVVMQAGTLAGCSGTTASTAVSGSDRTFTVRGVTFVMKAVAGGTFRMGSDDGDADGKEKPVHSVTLPDYMLGETEVTQELWQAVMGSNPSAFKGASHPVEKVLWSDCQAFIRKLNELTGERFRLPTEAEWEFAARGGSQSKGCQYAGSNAIDEVAWYRENSDSTTHDVKTKAPNELGLYDMTGNVLEWCQDWYGSYPAAAQTSPTGPATGTAHAFRGGSWFSTAVFCRMTYRNYVAPSFSFNNLGFRLAQ